jgi:transcriptional regulator with XRE-family HTH domain
MCTRSEEPQSQDSSSGDLDVDRVLRMVSILHAERLTKGLTLRKLSKMMKVDFTHLSRSERGLTQPGLVILMRWCRALDLEIESLFRNSQG